MAGSSEPAFSFEYKKGAIAPWMITHLFCNSPVFCGGRNVKIILFKSGTSNTGKADARAAGVQNERI